MAPGPARSVALARRISAGRSRGKIDSTLPPAVGDGECGRQNFARRPETPRRRGHATFLSGDALGLVARGTGSRERLAHRRQFRYAAARGQGEPGDSPTSTPLRTTTTSTSVPAFVRGPSTLRSASCWVTPTTRSLCAGDARSSWGRSLPARPRSSRRAVEQRGTWPLRRAGTRAAPERGGDRAAASGGADRSERG